jgi:hypothetical protein
VTAVAIGMARKPKESNQLATKRAVMQPSYAQASICEPSPPLLAAASDETQLLCNTLLRRLLPWSGDAHVGSFVQARQVELAFDHH